MKSGTEVDWSNTFKAIDIDQLGLKPLVYYNIILGRNNLELKKKGNVQNSLVIFN